jgi:hypothetical protein
MSEASSATKGMPSSSAVLRPADALPEGERIAEFEIRRVLGAGGFGIVYEAWDHALEREVALKEYLPVTLAGRGPGQRVTIRASNHDETFALGLRSFVNEARLLARFDHPSLLKVYRFWEDNGTAYMAMPMYHGRTLRQVRQAMAPGSPGETWVRALLEPMLGALERLHGEGVYHRDIAPDNILMSDEGRPVLLDFGAARRVIGDRTHALTAILKPHFAPIEQYADVSSVRQGPWTDLYGLAATVYYLLIGQPPLPAAARALHDELVPLARLQPAHCSTAFLEAIDWAMAVRPAERPQSAAIWRDVLEGRLELPPRARRGDVTAPAVAARALPAGSQPSRAGAAATGSPAGTDFDPTRPAMPAQLDAVLTGPEPAWAVGGRFPGTAPLPEAAANDAQALVPNPVAAASAPTRGEASGTAGPPAAGTAIVVRPSPLQAGGRRFARALPRAALLPQRWWLWGGAGSALALIAAFTWVVSSRPATAEAVARPDAAASATPLPDAAPRVAVQRGPAAASAATAAAMPLAAAVAAASAPDGTIAGAAEPPPEAARAAAAPPRGASPNRARRGSRESARPLHASAAERCAGRNFLSRLICMKHECDTDARLHADPSCVKMHREEEDRRQALANH